MINSIFSCFITCLSIVVGLRVEVVEEVPVGTPIINLLRHVVLDDHQNNNAFTQSNNIFKNYDPINLNFDLISSNKVYKNLFYLDDGSNDDDVANAENNFIGKNINKKLKGNGILKVKSRLDRESLCGSKRMCEVEVVVEITGTNVRVKRNAFDHHGRNFGKFSPNHAEKLSSKLVEEGNGFDGRWVGQAVTHEKMNSAGEKYWSVDTEKLEEDGKLKDDDNDVMEIDLKTKNVKAVEAKTDRSRFDVFKNASTHHHHHHHPHHHLRHHYRDSFLVGSSINKNRTGINQKIFSKRAKKTAASTRHTRLPSLPSVVHQHDIIASMQAAEEEDEEVYDAAVHDKIMNPIDTNNSLKPASSHLTLKRSRRAHFLQILELIVVVMDTNDNAPSFFIDHSALEAAASSATVQVDKEKLFMENDTYVSISVLVLENFKPGKFQTLPFYVEDADWLDNMANGKDKLFLDYKGDCLNMMEFSFRSESETSMRRIKKSIKRYDSADFGVTKPPHHHRHHHHHKRSSGSQTLAISNPASTTLLLTTTTPIDRESLDSCQIIVRPSDVAGNSGKKIIINVIIDDVNDNKPLFKTEMVRLELPEDKEPSSAHPLLVLEALDPDYGENGRCRCGFNQILKRICKNLYSF